MEPLKIGNITLPHRAVFGPMAGFTDAPCRRLMAQQMCIRDSHYNGCFEPPSGAGGSCKNRRT